MQENSKKFESTESKDVDSKPKGGRRNKSRKPVGSHTSSNHVTNKCLSSSRNNVGYYKTDENDPNWYTLGSQLVKDAGSLSFANFTGLNLEVGSPTGTTIPVTRRTYNNGAFMAVYIANLVGGGTAGAVDSATVAARRIYSWVRHANSGHANYEAPDLFMYCFAWGEVLVTLAELIRAYGVARYYPLRNRAVPDTALKFLGFNADEIRRNAADVRYHINLAIRRLNSLCVPAVFPLFARKAWLFSPLFCDATDDKAQVIACISDSYGVFSGTTETTGSSIVYSNWGKAQHTLNEWYNRLESQLNALLADEDINIMSGDILKAYGEGSVVQMTEMSEEHVIVPVYSEEFLTQLHNCIIHDGTVSNITQDSAGRVNQSIAATSRDIYKRAAGGQGVYPMDGILDLPFDHPTPDDVMVATRLRPAISTSFIAGTNRYAVNIVAFGTEIVRSIKLSYLTSGGALMNEDLQADAAMFVEEYDSDANSYSCVGNYSALLLLSKYHMAPLLPVWKAFRADPSDQQSSDTFYFGGYFGDVQNFTTISEDVLTKLHAVAVQSELGISNEFVKPNFEGK